MSDQDNLRDRIECVLHRTTGYDWHETAQAIIDEFGLAVETRVGYDTGLDHDELGRFGRVLGDWKEESEWKHPT